MKKNKEPKYSHLLQIIEKGDFNELKGNLDVAREKTLRTLMWTTFKGKLNINEEKGKHIWRQVFDYLSKNEFTENLFAVEESLAYFYHPIKSRLDTYVDSFLGGVCTAALFGAVNGYNVADRLEQKDFHKMAIGLIKRL